MSGAVERIVFLDRDTLRADVRRPSFAHEWEEYGETSAGEVVERLRGATIAIVNKVPLGADVLEQLPRLKLIAVAATGTDNVAVEFCRERGVAVSNVRGYARRTVPEHVLMLMLALRRNLVAYREDIEAGAWQSARQFCLLTHPIHDLHGSTLGIVGYGAIGRAVEKIASAFSMNVLVAEHKGATVMREGRTSFEEVLRRSDVVTLHAPLTKETRGMIGSSELASMRGSALLINCGRGGLVDERALVEALRTGAIAGAGVDVLSLEPPRETDDGGGNPLLERGVPNLIVTPHVAWASREAMQTLADQLIDNIEAFVGGRPRNLVTA
ncbi:MAG TPA: D-2-hydroxyacid dehydrogenase [Pyrinomonadaceae bacterium]|nr:D-2-hydroxyacid dehydrogenase [Pyrinomonadaceae bacterium]